MDLRMQKFFLRQLSLMEEEYRCEFEMAVNMMLFKNNLQPFYFAEHEDKLWKLLECVDDAVTESCDASFTKQDLIDALIFTSKVKFNPDYYLSLTADDFRTLLYLLAEQKRTVYSDIPFEDDAELREFLEAHPQ